MRRRTRFDVSCAGNQGSVNRPVLSLAQTNGLTGRPQYWSTAAMPESLLVLPRSIRGTLSLHRRIFGGGTGLTVLQHTEYPVQVNCVWYLLRYYVTPVGQTSNLLRMYEWSFQPSRADATATPGTDPALVCCAGLDLASSSG